MKRVSMYPKRLAAKTATSVTRKRLQLPGKLEQLCHAIAERGSVKAACADLGLCRFEVWRQAKTDEALATALWAARQIGAEDRWDQCTEIADDSKGDWITTPDGRRVVDSEAIARSRLRIETRMRTAGKLMESIYGEKASAPVHITNNSMVVCDEATRARLIAMREQLISPRGTLTTNSGGENPALPALVLDAEPEDEASA